MTTEVRVPVNSMTREETHNGLSVNQAFYLGPRTNGGIYNPLDEMFVLPGQQFGLPRDVLLETGTGLASLSLGISGITGVRQEGGSMVYTTEPLSPDDEVRVLSVMRTKEIFG